MSGMSQPLRKDKAKAKRTLQERDKQLSKIAQRFDRLDELLEKVESHIDSDEFQQIAPRKPK